MKLFKVECTFPKTTERLFYVVSPNEEVAMQRLTDDGAQDCKVVSSTPLANSWTSYALNLRRPK